MRVHAGIELESSILPHAHPMPVLHGIGNGIGNYKAPQRRPARRPASMHPCVLNPSVFRCELTYLPPNVTAEKEAKLTALSILHPMFFIISSFQKVMHHGKW